jgi:ATP-dependent exoDNAse (exonuclease V) beta subunit
MTLHAPFTAEEQVVSAKTAVLRVAAFPPAPELPSGDTDSGANIPPPALNWQDRHVGTVIHELLEQLGELTELPDKLPGDLRELAEFSLAQKGLAGQQLSQSLKRVFIAVEETLGDQKWGRWLLSSSHSQAYSELALTVNEAGVARDIVIDRTFVDATSGERWVVDYKSGVPVGRESQQQFLQAEADRYHDQLCRYRDAAAALGPEPVRCALYFTGLSLLHHLQDLDS